MDDIMKIVKSLEESVLLVKGVSEIIGNEAKERKSGFLNMTVYNNIRSVTLEVKTTDVKLLVF